MNDDPVMLALSVISLLLLVTMLLAHWTQEENERAIWLYDRLVWGTLPTPEELEQLAGHAAALVVQARSDAGVRAHRPVGFDAARREFGVRLAELDALLGDWQLRLLRCDGQPPAEPLPSVQLRLPSLRLLALGERLAHTLPVHPQHSPMYLHVRALRRGLRLAERAFVRAGRARPEDLPRRLDVVLADLRVLLDDAVASHRTLWKPFTEWRDTLPRPHGA